MKRVWLFACFALACHHLGDGASAGTAVEHVVLTASEVHDANIVVGTVEEQSLDDKLVASGTVDFVDTRVAHVTSPVSGRLSRIDAMLGDHVTKGQPLAFLDSPDMGLASSDVGKAQADLVAAEHDYQRKQALLPEHAVAPADVEQAQDAYEKAKAELTRVQEKLALFRGDGRQVSQGYALVSPLDGEIVARNVSPGAEVQGGYDGTPTELFTVANLSEVWVFADVYEVDVARVKLGAAATVHVLAYPDKAFPTHVDWIASALNPATRTVRLRCTLQNPDGLLKPEMFATVTVATEPRRALAVPRDAVARMGDQDFVFVALGATADGHLELERRPVTVDSDETAQYLAVEHGIRSGERVVIAGAAALARKM